MTNVVRRVKYSMQGNCSDVAS